MINQNKNLCIIQARMGSSRLPGKMTMKVGSKPLLEFVVDRVKKSKEIDKMIVATTVNPLDDELANLCASLNVECFRGSEDDVLDRFYQCAKYENVENIIRITGDCPFVDPDLIDKIIRLLKEKDADYAANVLNLTYPDGLDVEVVSFKALEDVWKNISDKFYREHVTAYIRDNQDKFNIVSLKNETDLSDLRLTVDYVEDLEFVNQIIKLLPKDFRLEDILNVLNSKPELKAINSNHEANDTWKEHASENNNFPQSQALFDKAAKNIPLASQTFSKSYLQFVKNNVPLFLKNGNGAHVWDVDGNKYLDFINGLLAIVLGYKYPAVDEAIKKQLENGINFSLASPLENELAEKLIELIPGAEMVRFGKNGSDVTTGAIRLARAITNRDDVAVCGYHGWHDWYIGSTTRNLGVPQATSQMTHKFEYNNIKSLEKLFEENPGKIAAVILEPINYEEPKDGFLEKVKEITHKHGALLIFDEIITGFRFDLGGAQKMFNVIPDLATFGKSMANGMPVSALVGKREYMQKVEDIFYSFTHGGETLSIAAALATIKEMEDKKVIDYLYGIGSYLMRELEAIIKENELIEVIKIKGRPCWQIMFTYEYNGFTDLEIKSFIQQELINDGILWYGQHNISFSHSKDDMDKLISSYKRILPILKEHLEKGNLKSHLKGEPITNIFKVR